MEKNIRSSRQYRSYDKSVPSFLLDRPRDVVQHIFPSRYHTELDESSITFIQQGCYEVSSENGSHRYSVKFGDDTTPPSCSCEDWDKFHLPCKHFCVIFRCVKDVGWSDLSANYINHPSFQLDMDCLLNTGMTEEKIPEAATEPEETHEEQIYLPLPARKPTVRRSLIQKCVNSLKTITDMVYTLKDTEFLEELDCDLTSLISSVKCHVPNECGIELLVTPKKENDPTSIISVTEEECDVLDGANRNVLCNLNEALDTRLMSASDQPAGLIQVSKAELAEVDEDASNALHQMHQTLNTEMKPASDPPAGLIPVTKEELDEVDEDASNALRNLNKVLDTDRKASTQQECPPSLNLKRKWPASSIKPLPEVKRKKKSKRLDTKHLFTPPQPSLEGISVADIDLDNMTPGQQWQAIGKYILTVSDKAELQSGKWLSDSIINAAQNLVSRENPFLGGLMDTVTLASGHVNSPVYNEAIQCHHLKNHWVTSASIGNKIVVYDSMKMPLQPILKKQLVDLYRCHASTLEGEIQITFKIAQFQMGSNDCGLFAIANMFSLASGIDPASISYHQDQMRPHLINCFEKQEMSMFPHQVLISNHSLHVANVTISRHCKCLSVKRNEPKLQCVSCCRFFH